MRATNFVYYPNASSRSVMFLITSPQNERTLVVNSWKDLVVLSTHVRDVAPKPFALKALDGAKEGSFALLGNDRSLTRRVRICVVMLIIGS